MSEIFTPAPIKERHEFPALSVRKPKPRALPGSRPLREPTGLCRLCYERATRFKAHTPLCARHYVAVNAIHNGGETAAVSALAEEERAARNESGTLRDRLRGRHAHLWPDRPTVDWFHAPAD